MKEKIYKLFSGSKEQSNVKSEAQNCVEFNSILEYCEQYREQLILYCQQYFKCEYEYAEDCVQNAYVALVENLKNGIEIRNYKSWLYAVALNYKNRIIKEKEKQNEYIFMSNKEKDEALTNAVFYEPDYVEDIVSDKMIAERALRILSSLSKDEKRLYIAYYIEDKKLAEIAEEFGISNSAIRKRHSLLRKKIYKKVKEYEEY